MATVAIPIETKVREFDGKLWLGLNLVSRGNQVTLGPSSEVSRILDIIEPDVYIAKDPGDSNCDYFDSLRTAGISVCGLDTEGGVFESIDQFTTNKREIIDHIDAFCAWGEVPASAVRHHHPDTDKIHVTGNPRFDLLQPQLRFIYQDRASSLNEQYGQYILVNCNFSIANPYSVKQVEKIEDILGSLEGGRRNYAHRIFHLYMESIYYLHSEFPESNIIIRPHPSEKNATYEAAFGEYEHVNVEDAGDARDWIAGASVVIHHDCTTGIESAMMGTPVVSYRPVQNEEYESRLPQIVSHEALSREELMEYVNGCLESDEPYEMDDEQTRELNQYFHYIDQSAAALICDVIESFDTTKQSNYEVLEPSLFDSLKRRIKSSGVSDQVIGVYDTVHKIFGNDSIPKQRQYRNQKFPGLERDEIIDSAEQMIPLLDIDDVSVEKVSMANDTYCLRSQ